MSGTVDYVRAVNDGAPIPPHPAVFPDEVIELAREAIADMTIDHDPPLVVLDPFAGTGGVHKLGYDGNAVRTIGVELMPKWAASHPDTLLGDATRLPEVWTGKIDAVFTSPCYGNRMADHHNADDKCSRCKGEGMVLVDVIEIPALAVPGTKRGPSRSAEDWRQCPKCKGTKLSHRRSYRHYYGDDFLTTVPREINAGAMAFGDDYKKLHRAAWAEVERVLRPGGRFVLNIKNHVRNGRVVRASQWHHNVCRKLGFVDLWRWDIPLDGYGFGANRGARVPTEQLYVMEKP